MKLETPLEPCATPGCKEPAESTHGFCTAHADAIFHAAVEQVSGVLSVARSVYFGRSGFPERRLLEHVANGTGRDHLLVVHWAANWPEIRELEESLIDAFTKQASFKRVENESADSDGAFTSPWNALYVSFSLKDAVKSVPGVVPVEHLHWRNRLWPNPVVPNPPVLLWCALDDLDAAKEVARFKSATDPARSAKASKSRSTTPSR